MPEEAHFCRALVVLAALFSSTGHSMAQPNWKLVGGNLDQENVFFDKARLERSGDKVKVWTLFNYWSPQTLPNGRAYQSMVSLDEVDCKKKLTRGLSLFLYAEPSGKGKVVDMSHTEDESGKPSPPDSAGDRVAEAACAASKKVTIKKASEKKQ